MKWDGNSISTASQQQRLRGLLDWRTNGHKPMLQWKLFMQALWSASHWEYVGNECLPGRAKMKSKKKQSKIDIYGTWRTPSSRAAYIYLIYTYEQLRAKGSRAQQWQLNGAGIWTHNHWATTAISIYTAYPSRLEIIPVLMHWHQIWILFQTTIYQQHWINQTLIVDQYNT